MAAKDFSVFRDTLTLLVKNKQKNRIYLPVLSVLLDNGYSVPINQNSGEIYFKMICKLKIMRRTCHKFPRNYPQNRSKTEENDS